MPRSVFKSIAPNFIGREVSIYCKHCKKRMISAIEKDSTVHCPICGEAPKGKNISLTMRERRELIDTLFAEDGDLYSYIQDLINRYSQSIEDISHGKLSKAAINRFYDYFGYAFEVIDDCATYYMKSPDSPDSSVCSESELARMNFREDRKINCFHYDSFKSQADIEGESLADYIEGTAYEYRKKNFLQHYDSNFNIKEFMEPLNDSTEREIVYLLYIGYNKKEVQAALGLTEARLRIIISHIKTHLTEPLAEDHRVKMCSSCHEVKVASDFGKDKRNKTDGLQSRCKACEALRKNNKRLQDKRRNAA